ncbi:MAG: alpha-ribazole phosphatase [Methylococcales bacterium]
MDIYLIRHTQTAATQGLCYGQYHVELADSFTDELAALQQKLPELKNDCRVYSSRLHRCLQLATHFSAAVITDERLLELNFGAWEGVLFNDIAPEALQYWTDNFVNSSPPNGESFTDLYLRAGAFWRELLATEAEQVLIFTHAGVIRALLAHILNLPLANAFQFRVDCGSVHKFQYLHEYTYIHYLNL